jgi:hypothetical protein
MDEAASPVSPAGELMTRPTPVLATTARYQGEQQLDFSLMPPGLSEQEKIVLNALYNNHTCEEAADRAGCDRTTIFRWRSRRPAFRAAYNLVRIERRSQTMADVHALAADALLGLRLAIDKGDDPRLNLALLKALGYLREHEYQPEPEEPAT